METLNHAIGLGVVGSSASSFGSEESHEGVP